jgi:hypothetical protein
MKCPKCGGQMSNPTYIVQGRPPGGWREGFIVQKEARDVLRRVCCTCGYEEDEAPDDAEKATAPA